MTRGQILGWSIVVINVILTILIYLGVSARLEYDRRHPVDPERYLNLRTRCLSVFEDKIPLSEVYRCEDFAEKGARK